MKTLMRICAAALLAVAAVTSLRAESILGDEARASLQRLYQQQPDTKTLGENAVAVLVFPEILKAGLVIGGAGGKGVLLRGDKDDGHYQSLAASFGLQAGAQKFGYALFFMNEGAVDYMNANAGWEIGAGPSVVFIDDGLGKKFSSATLTEDIYAVIFDQNGLMAGLGLEGSKITRIEE